MVLDNHSAHISKKTCAYLATRPNRVKYVLTPTHGLFAGETADLCAVSRIGS
jgi:hypothetical protein